MAYVKFLGVWLVAVLVTAALLFALTGTQDTLASNLRTDEKAACDNTSGGVVQISKEDCLRNADETLRDIAEEAQTDMLLWHFTFGVVILMLGTVFMFQIVGADAVAGALRPGEGLELFGEAGAFGRLGRGGDGVDHVEVDHVGVVGLGGAAGEVERLVQLVGMLQIDRHENSRNHGASSFVAQGGYRAKRSGP